MYVHAKRSQVRTFRELFNLVDFSSIGLSRHQLDNPNTLTLSRKWESKTTLKHACLMWWKLWLKQTWGINVKSRYVENSHLVVLYNGAKLPFKNDAVIWRGQFYDKGPFFRRSLHVLLSWCITGMHSWQIFTENLLMLSLLRVQNAAHCEWTFLEKKFISAFPFRPHQNYFVTFKIWSKKSK